MNEPAIALLRLVAEQEGLSVPRAAKRLALSQSQLLRLLSQLGPAESLGGLDWIEVCDGAPPRLRLRPAGHAALEAQS